MRISIGYDSHKLENCENGCVTLGGVKISLPYKVIAHSDGDTLCHSLIDCIAPIFLNKNIGELYSNTDPNDTGAYSLNRLKNVYEMSGKPKIINIDIIVVSDDVIVNKIQNDIKNNLCDTLGVKINQITIKGKTTEGENPSQKFIKAFSTILFE